MSEVPSGTYRFQLHAEFGFADAGAQADYLAALGVSHVYLSPILQATPGSAHGYDVVDHTRISADLGGEEGFRALAARLREAGLKVVVDIVPNHMAIPAPERLNRPLWEVLAHGPRAATAGWFDVDWDAGGGRIVLPVLGSPDETPVKDGDVLRYHDHVFPLPADHYRLAYWREGPNYRRFFEISTLIGLRAEDPEVFEAVHAVILGLVRAGLVGGLRIDHPDGLADPEAYLRRLAGATGGVWTVVEKILTGPEPLPRGWPCAGTTGYDALGMVGGLFVDPAGEKPLTDAYTAFIGGDAGFAAVAYEAKREVAQRGLRPEVARLHRVLCRALPSYAEADLETVLVELLVGMPVYRAYLPDDASVVSRAADNARTRLPAELHAVLDAVVPLAAGTRADGETAREFAVRFQQTAAPLMAKGVEDTAFYRWSRLASRNEVGGEPDRFAVTPAEFHDFCERLARDWPATMTTLSTHDTKRQEDVRARLAVLSELPAEWAAAVRGWSDRLRLLVGPERLPEPDLEYLLWQTLVGAWPLDEERLGGFLLKAAREAKTRTSWTDPDPAYEAALTQCASAVLANATIRATLEAFLARLLPYAEINSLGQKLVQLAMPGVPDVYQGCELTGLSLVDPDNRRPVDYAARKALLDRLDGGHPPDDLDGRKLLVTSRMLRLRRDRPEWFAGGYEPVAASGPAAEHVIAFRRGAAIAVATRLPVFLERAGGWGATMLNPAHRPPSTDAALSPGPGAYRDILTGARHDGPGIAVADLLAALPVALLVPADGRE